jgi:hypothetical protein
MNLTTYTEIKNELLDNWEQLTNGKYPEDLLYEFADQTVPVYYHEVIKEWLDLSMDETDAWQDLGMDANATIMDRMRVDLLVHYEREYAEAYRELCLEKQAA